MQMRQSTGNLSPDARYASSLWRRRSLLQVAGGFLLAIAGKGCAPSLPSPASKGGKVFLATGHGNAAGNRRDPGAIAGSVTEIAELMALRELVARELRARQIVVELPGDELDLAATIAWINARGSSQDIAVELCLGAYANPNARGATAYYIALNERRRQQALRAIAAIRRQVPELPSRGAKPDTEAALGRLAFCRDVVPQSLVLELGFITNPQDLYLLQTRRLDLARGVADGLQDWQEQTPDETPLRLPAAPGEDFLPRDRAPTLPISPHASAPIPQPPLSAPPVATYPTFSIDLNGQRYPEGGILISGNAYVPEPLAIRLGISPAQMETLMRVRFRGMVLLQAIALRDVGVIVRWDSPSRTLRLRTAYQLCGGHIDRIMGAGNTTARQLLAFMQANHPAALPEYGDLAQRYREEAAIEGVNHDIAFCQMCLETDFLHFRGILRPEQHNFGGLDATADDPGLSFPDRATGIRAHIQRLKAYASTVPLVQPAVDPGFSFTARGTAPLLSLLAAPWRRSPDYDRQILAILRRLYDSADMFLFKQ